MAFGRKVNCPERARSAVRYVGAPRGLVLLALTVAAWLMAAMLVAGFLALLANDTAAMEQCQVRHSFDTCHSALVG